MLDLNTVEMSNNKEVLQKFLTLEWLQNFLDAQAVFFIIKEGRISTVYSHIDSVFFFFFFFNLQKIIVIKEK